MVGAEAEAVVGNCGANLAGEGGVATGARGMLTGGGATGDLAKVGTAGGELRMAGAGAGLGADENADATRGAGMGGRGGAFSTGATGNFGACTTGATGAGLAAARAAAAALTTSSFSRAISCTDFTKTPGGNLSFGSATTTGAATITGAATGTPYFFSISS